MKYNKFGLVRISLVRKKICVNQCFLCNLCEFFNCMPCRAEIGNKFYNQSKRKRATSNCLQRVLT